jgi:hypothetical protein
LIGPNHNFQLFTAASGKVDHQMLRDITTRAQVNSGIIPCIRHKSNKAKGERRRVKFDAEGMPPSGKY